MKKNIHEQSATPAIKPAYLKPKEAAQYLSVSVTTLYALKGVGILKFYKLGGATLLKVSEIDAAVEKGVMK